MPNVDTLRRAQQLARATHEPVSVILAMLGHGPTLAGMGEQEFRQTCQEAREEEYAPEEGEGEEE